MDYIKTFEEYINGNINEGNKSHLYSKMKNDYLKIISSIDSINIDDNNALKQMDSINNMLMNFKNKFNKELSKYGILTLVEVEREFINMYREILDHATLKAKKIQNIN